MDGERLVKALLSVVGYCATEESRPVLTGVTLYLGDNLAVAGADSFRLAYLEFPGSLIANGAQSIIIPARAVEVLGQLWQKSPGSPMESGGFPARLLKRKLELALGKDRLQARFGRVTLITQIIEGTPPNHRQLIPQEIPLQVRVSGSGLERAVRMVAEVAKDGSGIVRLIWSGSSLKVSAKGDEAGRVEVNVPVEAEGGEGKVAINASYLLDYLAGRDGFVTMGVRTPSDPVLFQHSRPPLVLLMPMFVQW